MVIRRRLRAILFPLALLAFSGPLAAYFVWHAVNGSRGIKAKDDYRAQMEVIQAEKVALVREKTGLERRISMLRRDSVEMELLDEEARSVLGRVHKNDVVLFNSRIK